MKLPGETNRNARRARTASLALFVAAVVCLASSARPAAAALVNCAQEEQEEGDGGNIIHFDPAEVCFANKEAKFEGFSVLMSYGSADKCEASLSGGVFDGSRWVWSDPETYVFRPYQTREVYYDLTRETDMPVGKIALLHTGKDLQKQCGGDLTVRFTKNDPLPMRGSYYGSQDKDAWFKIMSEDVARIPRGIPAALGRSFVRLPEDGPYSRGLVVEYEFYTDVERSKHPLDHGKKDDPADDERFYSQYHLERWDEAARAWETLRVSRPKDVSDTVVACGNDVVDCYGDRGRIRLALSDGHYRLRARHSWGRMGWQSWSPWRRFSVDRSTPLLAEPEIDPTRRSLFELWLRDGLLGPESIWKRTIFGSL